jgi:hypothetical protein
LKLKRYTHANFCGEEGKMVRSEMFQVRGAAHGGAAALLKIEQRAS